MNTQVQTAVWIEGSCPPDERQEVSIMGGSRHIENSGKTGNRKTTLLKSIISIGILGYLLYLTRVENFFLRLQRLSFGFIVFAWFYYVSCQWLSAYRWQLFLKVKQIEVPLSRLFSFYMVGMFLNNVMPGAVGGDIAKSYDLYKYTNQSKYAVLSVFLERFTGFIGISLIGVLAMLIGFRETQSPLAFWAVFGTALFLTCITVAIWYPPLSRRVRVIALKFFPKTIGEKLDPLYEALSGYREHPNTLFRAIALSVLLQLMMALYYSLTANALGIPIDMKYFILFLPLVTLISVAPISLGGLGVKEATMVLLFAEVGVSAPDVLAVSLTVHILNTLLSFWGGAILFFRKPIPASSA